MWHQSSNTDSAANKSWQMLAVLSKSRFVLNLKYADVASDCNKDCKCNSTNM